MPYSIGVDPEFIDYIEACEAQEGREYWAKYNAFLDRYPTCWLRFLNWLGLK
jgi:hypothetical protein